MAIPDTYSVETYTRVYNDNHGGYVQIGPDSDGLGLCEIRYVEEEQAATMIVPWQMALLVADAIRNLAEVAPE